MARVIAFHKGLLTELRNRLQYVGIRIEEPEATALFSGMALFGKNTEAHRVSMEYAEELFRGRHELMKDWEEAHPGAQPFPPRFAEVVLALLRADLDLDPANPTIIELIKLAEAELS